ncbi:AGE family epimerase/isomerase [Mucilaginibacter terrae]|uniref:Mannose/cellobiose epimerase-like protein (N-acyl-D-glucosamine 2-epimerase family) n=1 Tax=Mucilaginibacter terrae TaxID=1955052 RepID=A0ABU3GPI9_9SPHI|nr:AGE family epimerase/isomerase [Mucilaginibacter terrae]MDT3401530.1 mannose/cellobiose epimerase-like protein (N-acyl-D-glucosamine 2-epimerase family) [Mucilaginibacter terrae]
MDINFTFSDTIAGYVTDFSLREQSFKLKTSDDREFLIHLMPNTYARFARNLGEPYQDATGQINHLLALPRQMVFAYGTFYPGNGGTLFQAQWLVFPGKSPGNYRHEEPDWWIKQIESIGHSYLKWQFNYPEEPIDYHKYRTFLHLGGGKHGDYLQETDTISRLVYGFASAYLLTGKDEFLEAAEAGTNYLRDHMRFLDQDEDIVYWFHGIKVDGEKETKLLTSEFGDDYDSIPMYEQIYALTGPTQTMRITGDTRIMSDIDKTLSLFERFYKDEVQEGYFSHIDPIMLSAHDESLGANKARKNWNSIGDHAPAYLINLYLATGDPKHADFLEYTFDTITRFFPDYLNSPFVQEKFFEDWSKDQVWGWQQNRAVIGHNLKIAWNLMRMQSLKPKVEYLDFARKIAEEMPEVGADRQRGGWYDVVDRVKKPDGVHHEFSFHDRKAWWQQEQAILAYLIMHGILKDDEYLRHAREVASFYSAFFLDTDDGGVYFNTLANGLPYLVGNERFKGSHSMSGYHSMELCYLSATYINLLIKKEPMFMYFKPYINSFKDNILRVSPDILPEGSIYIEAVFIDNEPYENFDANGLFVNLPQTDKQVRVKVKLTPKTWLD